MLVKLLEKIILSDLAKIFYIIESNRNSDWIFCMGLFSNH